MTDLPPDAGGAAPDFDAVRSPAPAAAPGQDPDPGNPAGGGPQGGAGRGLTRLRAVAARLTGRGQGAAAQDTGEPAAEAAEAAEPAAGTVSAPPAVVPGPEPAPES